MTLTITCVPVSGIRCEMVQNLCLSNPCQNGGICVQEGAMYTCNCSLSYSGTHCEDIILPSVSSSTNGINRDEIYVISGMC